MSNEDSVDKLVKALREGASVEEVQAILEAEKTDHEQAMAARSPEETAALAQRVEDLRALEAELKKRAEGLDSSAE